MIEKNRPLGEKALGYLAKLDKEDLAIAMGGLKMLATQATPSFNSTEDDPRLIVTMPVAAHQEGSHIGKALEQYTKQKDAPPHRVVLFCNSPEGADTKAVDQTMTTIVDFMQHNPQVPLGFLQGEVSPGTPIGKIRKHVTDVAFTLLADSELDDALIVNHDADITKMNTYHFANLYKAFSKQDVTTVTPRCLHERGLRDKEGKLLFPNIDKATAWFDLANALGTSYYELGNGVSARKLIEVGGYDPSKREGETLDILTRIHGDMFYGPGRVRVPGATLVSSSRRLIHRLNNNPRSLIFWDGDFDAVDAYRDEAPDKLSDITWRQRDSLITHELVPFTRSLVRHYLKEGLTYKDAHKKASGAIRLGLLIIGSTKKVLEKQKAGTKHLDYMETLGLSDRPTPRAGLVVQLH